MASRFIIFSLTASLLISAGCSKNRGWLSRSDYSEMQDPFMEPQGAIAGSRDRNSKDAGRATLDDSDQALAERSSNVAGPKPLRQASASDNTRRVSPAIYPENTAEETLTAAGTSPSKTPGVTSYSGPALSDFLQKRKAAAGEAANRVDQLPARTVSSANAAARETLNPATTRAALPNISPETESFSNFLAEKAKSTSQTAQDANQQVQNASAEVNNFAAWAEQRNAEWSETADAARSTAADLPLPVKEKATSVFQQARQASQEMADSMATPEFDDIGSDAAMPLIQQSRPALPGPALPKAKAPLANDSGADENPFADSSGAFHTGDTGTSASTQEKPTATSSAATQSKSTTSLDDSFRMDTGWKPAHMTRP